MDDLFCRDCAYSEGEGKRMRCNAPENSVTTRNVALYFVTGEKQPIVSVMRGATCTALRTVYSPDIAATVCGPEGKWFKEKE